MEKQFYQFQVCQFQTYMIYILYRFLLILQLQIIMQCNNISNIPISTFKTTLLNKTQLQKFILKTNSTKQLLSQGTLIKTIEDINKMYISKQNLIQLMQFYNKYCQASIQNLQRKQQSDSFWQKLGQNFLRLSTNIFFDNLDTLVALDNIVKNISSFKDIKENSYQQINKLFKHFRFGSCQIDSNAFAYLYIYLELQCKQMGKKYKKVDQISSWFKQILQRLAQEYPPAPKLQQSQSIRKHATFKQNPKNYSQPKLSLLDIPKDEKRDKIMNFIEAQAAQANKNMKQFTEFLISICRQCNGSHLKIGKKVKSISDQKATSRVIQKLFKTQLKEYKKIMNSKLNSQTLDEYFKEEKQQFDRALKSIIQSKSQLTFTITDMLQGKCVFETVQDINICAQGIKWGIFWKKYQLIQLDNRLLGQTGTSDVVFKIKIGQTITEFQLALQANDAQNGFSHKIYEIQRSTFFDPINFLRIYNQTFSNDYLQKTASIIQINNKFSTHQEQQIIYHDKTKQNLCTFHQLKSSWSELSQILLYQKEYHQDQDDYRIEIKKDQLQTIGYGCIVRNQSNEHYFINALFFSGMKKHKQAVHQLDKIIKFTAEKQKIKIWHKKALQLNFIGDDKKALSLFENCFQLQKVNNKGLIESMDTASILKSIGLIYKNMGNNPEALKYYKECLQIQLKIKGKGSIDTASTLNNIGSVYKNMGNNPEALKYYKECLQIQQKIKAKGAIDTASTLNNIGSVYRNMGNNPEALKYYKKCLQIQQKIKAKGAIDKASTLNNIGVVYDNIGNNPEALKYYKECLQIQQRIKGKGAIDTASTLNNIGSVYVNMGNNPEALKYYKECLQIQLKIKGKGAIDTASTLNNIGSVYVNMGNNSQALKYYKECLQIQLKIKGKGSIDTASTLNNIGSVYKNMGNNPEALKYYKECLQIQQKIKGKGAIDTASTLNNIGSVYRNMGNNPQALKYYKECLQIQQKIKAKGAIDPASTLNNIGSVYVNMGNNPEALNYYKECLQIQQKIKGKGAIDTASTLYNIGLNYQKLGQINESFRCSVQAYLICFKVYGQSHQKTQKYKDRMINMKQKLT